MIRTVDFAPTNIRRNDFWAASSAIFCAALMWAVTFAAAVHSPTNQMAVVAGAFDCRAASRAGLVREPCLCICNMNTPEHLEDVSDSCHALLTKSGFEPVTRQG